MRITRRGLAALALAPVAASAQPAAPKRGGAITVAQCSANRFVASPVTARHPYFTVDLTTRIPYNALLWVDREMRLQPELATAWTPASADQSVWDITLRPEVRFHDGTPLRPEDVVASYELHRRRNFASGQIQKIEALPEGRVRFTLDAGNSEFPYVLAEYQNMIMPAAPIETIGNTGIGTGPFRFASTDPNRVAVYERNPSYWRAGFPYLDRIELHNREGQQETALAGLRSGQFDMVMTIDPRSVRTLQRDADLIVDSGGGGHHYVVALPKYPGSPFEDRRVRQAFSLGVDREAIVRLVYGEGNGWVGNDSHLVAADPNFLPLPRVPRAEAVARARALLAEAGHPNGIDLGTLYWSPQSPEVGRYFQVLQESAREAGLMLALEQRPADGYVQFRTGDNDFSKGSFHRFAMTAVGPRNPGISLFRMRGATVESGHWRGAEHDAYMELYATAMREGDAERRRDTFHRMQRILHAEVPALLPAGTMTFSVRRRHVQGFAFHPQIWSVRFDEVWRG
jgi:peptide/nickel transport system substrate-binding protein